MMEVDRTDEHEEDIQQDKFEETGIQGQTSSNQQTGDYTHNGEEERGVTNNVEGETNTVEKNMSTMTKEVNTVEEEANNLEEEPVSEEEPFSSDDSIANPNYLSEV